MCRLFLLSIVVIADAAVPQLSMGKPFMLIPPEVMQVNPDAAVTAFRNSDGKLVYIGGTRNQEVTPQNCRWMHMSSEAGGLKAVKNNGKITVEGYACPEGYDKNCLESHKAKGGNVGLWPANVYRINDKEILVFIHLEFRGGKVDWNIREGLAYSKDGGMTFQWVGYIAGPSGQCGQEINTKCTTANMGLVNYIIKDGYIQIYFQDNKDASHPVSATGDSQVVATARANLTEVVAGARQLKVTQWFKYHNGAWTEPAIGGDFTALNLKSQGYMHGDAIYIKPIDQYAIVQQSGDRGSQSKDWRKSLLISFSHDGMTWSDWQNVYSDGRAGDIAYPSIMSYGPDNEVAGSTFAVTWTNGKGSNVKEASMIAVNVTVSSGAIIV